MKNKIKMRSHLTLFELRNTAINKLRRDDCQGCMYNHGSQKHHLICLTGVDAEYYHKEALIYLRDEKLINNEEYELLQEIRIKCN